MGLSFGVTVLPDPPYRRFLELLQLAERHGFEYGWTYDSHVLWQDSFPTLALGHLTVCSLDADARPASPRRR